jgi:hypothetical protein
MDESLNKRISDLEQKLNRFMEDYYRNSGASSQIITKNTTFSGKVGFYGAPVVDKASAITALTAPSGIYVQSEALATVNAVNSLRTVLSNLGITA